MKMTPEQIRKAKKEFQLNSVDWPTLVDGCREGDFSLIISHFSRPELHPRQIDTLLNRFMRMKLVPMEIADQIWENRTDSEHRNLSYGDAEDEGI